jgi:Zn-dependent protease
MSDLEQTPPAPWVVPPPDFALLPAVPITVTPSLAPPPVYSPRYGRALLLFLATLFTATTLGPVVYISTRTDVVAPFDLLLTPSLITWVWRHSEILRLGLSFSIPALAILLAHEMGHYLMCRRYGLESSLPYFLPTPVWVGTLGAFIRIRSPLRTKRELFDVAIAGPLAGFVVIVPFLVVGIARSVPAALRLAPGESLLVPARCLAMEAMTRLFHGTLPPGTVLNLHPFALAAWLGLLATALNLIPLSQLDGGHLLYALVGRRHRTIAVVLWAALAIASFHWEGWTIWCVLTAFIGLRHPPVVDEAEPLDPKRRWLAIGAFVMLVVCFTPYPLREVNAPVPMKKPDARDGLVAEARIPPPLAASFRTRP